VRGAVRNSVFVLIAMAPAIAHAASVTVEVDNAWARASRVILAPHEKLPARDYPGSVIVYLTENAGHKAGGTAYIAAGNRAEKNAADKQLEEVVIELKSGAPRSSSAPVRLDPVKLDPKYHTVDFENEQVRVLRTVLEPHIKSPMHEHPHYVVVYVTELHTTMALADGKLVDNPRRPGEVAWRDGMKHSTENVGTRTAMEIQVELK
jgi:hypothetical protein